MAVLAVTDLPAKLDPKKNAGAALTAFIGLSRALNRLNKLMSLHLTSLRFIRLVHECSMLFLQKKQEFIANNLNLSFYHDSACIALASYFYPRKGSHPHDEVGHGLR